ncbi:MAG: enoyl-CoA hydratase/isomerase family protein [Thermodesulfobacteriota bacterium]|nr:enoyl-CoA hydratase/isomerase family protein [Thermodesulfobacteriota bacterium]
MSGFGIRVEQKGRVAILTLDRPEKMNAFNEEMWSSLDQAVSKLEKELPRVVVVTGAGDKAFSAGFDINPDNPQVSGLIDAVQKHDREPVEVLIRRIRGTVDRLVTLPVPIIAAINGIAYGGGAELAARSDLRVMDPDAIISFSEVRLGLMTDWGGGVALTRVVGPAKAADLILTARQVKADEAFNLGLVNRVSAPGKALDESIVLGEIIAKNGPRAIHSALALIRKSADLPLEDALEFETELAVTLIASGECYHGISAFLSKKEPEFPDI